MLNIDLNNPMLHRAVEAFHGKVRLRLGGSLGDFVIYDVPGAQMNVRDMGYCADDGSSFGEPVINIKIGYKYHSGCLRMDRWDALNQFCKRAGCTIAFGLNGLFGRTAPTPACSEDTNCRRIKPPECCTSWSGAWNPANAEALIRYTKDKGYPVAAWELGNELVGKRGIQSHIGVEEYLQDWRRFVDVVNSVYGPPHSRGRPLLVAPDTTWMTDWFGLFLHKLNSANVSLSPDVVSHRLYSMGPGVNPLAWRMALNDSAMNEVQSLGKQVSATVRKASPRAQIWLGEGGGAYNSGANNVTNSFNSGFWFLDQMGSLASTGHASYCRQTLAGGFYSLLNSETLHPNPDYYILLAWSRLMGREVLHVSRGQAASAATLRAYAHCMAPSAPSFNPGGITLVLINLSNSTSVQATLYTTERRDLLSLPREEYLFSSACRGQVDESLGDGAQIRAMLACRQVLLNGAPLLVGEDGTIPAIKSAPVRGASERPLVIKPLTYGFVSIPRAKAAACLAPSTSASAPAPVSAGR